MSLTDVAHLLAALLLFEHPNDLALGKFCVFHFSDNGTLKIEYLPKTPKIHKCKLYAGLLKKC